MHLRRPHRWFVFIAVCSSLCVAGCGSGSNHGGSTGGTSTFQSADTQMWIEQFGTGTAWLNPPNSAGLAGDTLAGVTVDPQGNVAVSGSTLGAFPGFTNPGVSDDVVAKLSTDGHILWTQQFGTNSGDFMECIASDQNGNFYSGGSTNGAFPGYSNASQALQGVVTKLDGAGSRVWLSQFPVLAATTDVSSIVADKQGGVIIAGYSNTGSNISTQEVFVARLDASTGKQLWLSQFGPGDDVNGLAVDASGNVFISGLTSGTFPGTPSGQAEPFIMKLNASGAKQWVQHMQSSLNGVATAIFSLAVTSTGDVVAGGATSSGQKIADGQGALPSDSALLAELDGSTGNIVWLKQFSSGSGDEIDSVAIDPQGNIVVTGMTNGAFASAFQQPSGQLQKDDIFLLKFTASGQNIWVQQFGNGMLQRIIGPAFGPQVATDASGKIFVGSVTQGAFAGFSNPNNAVEMFVGKFGP